MSATTVVLSRRDVDRFVPPGQDGAENPRTYVIAPLDWRTRAQFNAALARAGTAWRNDDQVIAAVRAAVAEVSPENVDELLADIDAFVALRKAQADAPPVPAPEPKPLIGEDGQPVHDEDGQPVMQEPDPAPAELDELAQVRAAYGEIERAMAGHPTVAAVLADRVLFQLMAPGIAASYALRGWSNLAVPFIRRAGVVPDEALSLLPPEDLTAVGWRAMELMRPTEAVRGN